MSARGSSDYERRPKDMYPTPEYVTRSLLRHSLPAAGVKLRRKLCDPCAGKGHMIRAFKACGHLTAGGEVDFLSEKNYWRRYGTRYDIVTNPPYGDRRASLALKFIEKALEVVRPWGGRVVMLLPVDFDSGKSRTHVFDHQAFKCKITLTDRIKWFNDTAGSSGHSWFVWDWANEGRQATLHHSRIVED
jgi:hypothetical protein